MKLRHKFGLLAFLYVITLAANFFLCSWCLLLYYDSFLEHRASEPAGINVVRIAASSQTQSEPACPSNHLQDLTGDAVPSGPAHEAYILRVLGINAVCGLAVGLMGLILVRRWVIRPIACLHDAAVEIGHGNLSYRIDALTDDELGELGDEVNKMADGIVIMQGQMVEHERRRVASQALRCIVHNIRGPLTGIRWLSEAIGMRNDLDAQTARTQSRIVEIVDRILAWLQSFRESLAAMSMRIQEVSISSVIREAASGCTGFSEKRGIRIIVHDPSDIVHARVEQGQVTSALKVLLRNVVTRTAIGCDVHLRVDRPKQYPGYWRIEIESSMPIVPEGTPEGLSSMEKDELAMAERVVRLHGGRLLWEDGSERSYRCFVMMPG